jgi:hypothetical protein
MLVFGKSDSTGEHHAGRQHKAQQHTAIDHINSSLLAGFWMLQCRPARPKLREGGLSVRRAYYRRNPGGLDP